MNYNFESTPFAIGGEKAVHRGTCVETRLSVVLKFLKQPYSAADKERFAQEIRRLTHAKTTAGIGVSTLIDHNLEWDPPFYVEEYFPDGTLAKRMHDRFATGQWWTPESGAGYARQLLHTLAGIHAGNQIHRDVKPANIMWIAATRRLVIGDMGLGRTLERPSILQTRAFCGTRGYAAPEQELGTSVDHRADMYAVGVILHEMTTWLRGAHDVQTFAAHAGLRGVIAGLLAFRREHRYRSAADAVQAISSLGIANR